MQAALRHKHPITTVGYLEKNMSRVSLAQKRIGTKIDFKRREIGEEQATPPSGDCI